jgi:VWFA-related protein
MIRLTQSSRSHSYCSFLAVAAVALCLALAVPRLVAQASTPPPKAATTATQPAQQAQQTPAENPPEVTLHTNVDEVSLDMVVHDKGKKSILDLKPEDLQVTDEGTPVKLTGLHLVREDSSRGHAISFVFDPFSGATAKSAQQAAEKVLKALPAKGYSICVLDLRGRLRLIQGFTEDRKAIGAAIDTATASIPVRLEATYSRDVMLTDKADPDRTKTVEQAEKDLIAEVRTGADTAGHRLDVTQRPYAKSLLDALLESQTSLQEKRGYMNLDAILALIHSQQKLGDRKAIVYFTHNVMMDSSAKERLKTISADSLRAGVTIYTVDLDALNQKGQYQLDNAMLNGKPPFNPTPVVANPHGDTIVPMQQQGGYGIQGDIQADGSRSWGTRQDIAMMTDFTRRDPAFSWNDTRSPMAQLSKDTGGIYMDAEGSIKKLLQQMVEDLSTYYTATYIPPIKEYDGSFRTIAVKPLRSGIRVQSKTGYFAVAPGTDESIRPFEVPLQKALAMATPPADVTFRSSVLRFGEMPDGNTNSVVLEIPYATLQLKKDAHTDLYSTQATVFAQIKDAQGTVVEHFGDQITRRGALESLDRNPAAAITFSRHFIATPGKYTLEVAVMDPPSGRIGARKSTFEIPAEAKSASVSDMVLVSKLDKLPAEQADNLDPLRYEKDHITPNVSGELPADTKGLSLFLLLHPDASSTEPGTLEMQVVHNGNAGRRTPLPLNMNAGQLAVPYLASFGSGAVAPGQYVVKAFFSQAGKTAEQDLAFHVAGDTATVASKASDAGVTAIAAPPEVNAPGQLTITALNTAAPPLSLQEASLLIEDARERAVGYGESLPNFMCVEVTNRSVDPGGVGDWKLKDTIVSLMRFRDKHETRTTLEVNGQTSTVGYEAMKGALSVGEFGGVLRSVFNTKAQATFKWKETDELKGGTVQVFDYTVDKAHSGFGVVGTNGREVISGFHGRVFVDSATRSVRRITLIADLPADVPRDFGTRASSLSVDYDYVAINAHDYLMPVSAEMRLVKGRHAAALNTIEFRNYRRFGSNVRIVDFKPVDPQQK